MFEPDPASIKAESPSGEILAAARRAEVSRISASSAAALHLFEVDGAPSPQLSDALRALNLRCAAGSEFSATLIHGQELPQIEAALQAAFFKPNESRWSYEVAGDGVQATPAQLAVFDRLGMIAPIAIPQSSGYDVAAILGGTLEAVVSRTKYLLSQPVEVPAVALLGGKRKLDPAREGPEKLRQYLGEVPDDRLPKTEYEMMRAVWESYFCKVHPHLATVKVIGVDAEPSAQRLKSGPGTPETVVGLWNALLEQGGPLPQRFILASSQPFAPRQELDFIVASWNMGMRFSQCDVVGYAAEKTPSLKLFGQELAKMVHGHFLLAQGV